MEWYRSAVAPAWQQAISEGRSPMELPLDVWKQSSALQPVVTPEIAKQTLTSPLEISTGEGQQQRNAMVAEIGKSPTALKNLISDPVAQEQLERNGIFTQPLDEIVTHNTKKVPGLEPGMVVIHHGKPYVFAQIYYNDSPRESELQLMEINPDGTWGTMRYFMKRD
jgi:hypothetical protein